jgi:hypothetical protein
MLNQLLQPLNPPITNLTIYYPISRSDEFAPIPVTYNSPNPISSLNIIKSIMAFYGQQLNENNVAAYVQRNPAEYSHLLEEIRTGGRVRLVDVMGGRVVVESLMPRQNGYELFLGV